MKRLKVFSVILTAAVLMSACSSKTTETTASTETSATTEATTEETTEASETTKATEVTETTEAKAEVSYDTAFEDVAVTDYVSVSKEEGSKNYVPHFTIEGEAFEEANTKIDELCKSVSSDPDAYVRYAIIDVSSREFSLVVYGVTSIDVNEYVSFTVDTSSKEILDNNDILALGGEPASELYEDAEFSISTFMEDASNYDSEIYENTFSKDNINKDMFMFLGHNYNLFLGSDIGSMGGSDYYFEIYDLDGNNYSKGGDFRVPEIADKFLLNLRENNDGTDLVFASLNGNELELYEVVEGKLELIDKIDVTGTMTDDKYKPGLTITADGSSAKYTLSSENELKVTVVE